MYKLCKTEQSAKRQRELEHLLLDMMQLTRYEEISVKDFCQLAQMPRKAFYRYFSSKDGALYALIDHTLLEMESFPTVGSSLTGIRHSRDLEAFFRFWQGQKSLLDALYRSGISSLLVTRTIAYALSNQDAVRGGGDMWEYSTTFGVCGFMSIVLRWHAGGYLLPPEHMAKIAMKLLTAPLIPPQDA